MDVNPSSDVPDPIVGRVYVDQDGRWWRYLDVSSTVVGTRDFHFAALDGIHHRWIAEETWKQNPMTDVPDPIVGGVYVDQDGLWWQYQGVSTGFGERSFHFASLRKQLRVHIWISEDRWKQNPMRGYEPEELSPRDRPRPQIRDKTTPPRQCAHMTTQANTGSPTDKERFRDPVSNHLCLSEALSLPPPSSLPPSLPLPLSCVMASLFWPSLCPSLPTSLPVFQPPSATSSCASWNRANDVRELHVLKIHSS